MKQIIMCKNQKYIIHENEYAYVSPYSKFLIKYFPLISFREKSICDFGAGTGILGIVSSSYFPMKITFIENNFYALRLLEKNCQSNSLPQNIEISLIDNSNNCKEYFDIIICNPASLPSIANVNSFCDGGDLGIDMICNVLEFSRNHLSESGKLYMIITSILPQNMIIDKFRQYNLAYKIIAKQKLPFRPHYHGIKEWVDQNKEQYGTMEYYEVNNILYEEIRLFEIWSE